MNLFKVVLFALVITLSTFSPAHALTKYNFKDLTAQSGGVQINPVAINASGSIVGTSQFTSKNKSPSGFPIPVVHAFIYDGTLHDLGVFGGVDKSEGFAVNASGQVVGRSSAEHGYRAFLYDGTMHDLGSKQDSGANAINASGHVTGYQFATLNQIGSLSTYNVQRAFFYDGKTLNDLALVVGDNTIGVGIDDNDRILVQGQGSALIYENGKAVNLGSLGGNDTKAAAISSNGKAVGSSKTDKNEIHAFLYDGTMHDLGMLPGSARSEARAINAQGTVVGMSGGSRGRNQSSHAFVYEGSKMTDLNDLLVGDHSGLELADAVAISDTGAIIVKTNKGPFLLTPANGPEIKADEARIAAGPPPEKLPLPMGNLTGANAKIDRSNKSGITLTFTNKNGDQETHVVERSALVAGMLGDSDVGAWVSIAEDGQSGTNYNVSATGGVIASPMKPMMILMQKQKGK